MGSGDGLAARAAGEQSLAEAAPRAAGSAKCLHNSKRRMAGALFREVDRLVNREHVAVRVEFEPMEARLFSPTSCLPISRYAVVFTEPLFEEARS